MANKHAEELCALMDGELGNSQARFLLKRLAHEQHLVARWRRYHYVRAVIGGENPGHPVGLGNRVSAAIALEPVPSQEATSTFLPAWLRPVAGFAVAASVSVAAFTLTQDMLTTPDTDQASSTVSVAASTVRSEQLPAMNLRAQPASAVSGPSNSRLQAYVMRHNAVAVPRRGRDLVPYIYLVTTPVSDAPEDQEAMKPSDQSAAQQSASEVNQ